MRFLVNNRNPDGGVTYHRIQKPFQFLKRAGHEVELFIIPEDIKGKEFDYLVFNRSLGWKDAQLDARFILACKDAGMKIIVDIDDYWNLPDHHTIILRPDIDYQGWRNHILQNLRFADYIWTTNDFLRLKLAEEVPNVPIAIAPNAIDYNEPQWTEKEEKKYPKQVNFGWFASTTHHMDADQLRRPIAAINKQFRDKINWHMVGGFTEGWAGEVYARFIRNFTNDREKRKKPTNLVLHQNRHVKEYGKLYSHIDVSFAPVICNDFNKAKSELKVIEAGARWLPFIGSDCLTFSRSEANIDLCSTPQEWAESFKDLLLSKSLRDELGQELGEFVRDNYRIEKSNNARLSIL